ncbi:MAG TPA: hypothetical protein VKP60_05150 [Magnetospirillaceae bacterium]|nr:hypothetical protein [Magnetospirillaceae bacterium]
MILTPVDLAEVPRLLDDFADALAAEPGALAVLARIRSSLAAVDGPDITLSQREDHHAQAVALLRRFGLGTLDHAPEDGVTWDGQAVAIRMEPSVIVHEVAHYQLATPDRRHLADFGLGAGPESGDKALCEAERRVFGVDCDREEALASLLGVLWEAELGQPAVLAFLEQNWLEGGAVGHNVRHFVRNVMELMGGGFVDQDGRPTTRLR